MAIRTYNDWYLAHKEALAEKIRRDDHTEGEKLTAEIVRYSHLKNHLLAEEHEAADIIIACDDDGEPDEFTEVLVKDYFAAHPEIKWIDSESLNEENIERHLPSRAQLRCGRTVSTRRERAIMRTTVLSGPGFTEPSALNSRRRTADTQRDLRANGMSSRSVMCRRYSTTDTTGWSCGTEI